MKTIIVLPIPGIENFKPKKILRSSPSLEIPSTPPWGFTWHVISIIAENKSHAHHNTHLHTVNAVA